MRILSEAEFCEIKEYLKTHSKAEASRKFGRCFAIAQKIDRSKDYKEYRDHVNDLKYFSLQTIEEILAEVGESNVVENFNNEWYFDQKYQDKGEYNEKDPEGTV